MRPTLPMVNLELGMLKNQNLLAEFLFRTSKACMQFIESRQYCRSESLMNEMQCNKSTLCAKCRFRLSILLFDVPFTKGFKRNNQVKKHYEILCRVWPNIMTCLKTGMNEPVQLQIVPSVSAPIKKTNIVHFLEDHLKKVPSLNHFLKNKESPNAPHVHTFYRCGLINSEKTKSEFHGWSDTSEALYKIHKNQEQQKSIEPAVILAHEKLEQNFKNNFTSMAKSYYKDHKYFFVNIFSSLIKHCLENLAIEICELIADSIYTSSHVVLPWIQVLSSYVNGFYYYPPLGLYKRSESSVYQFYTEWYGPEIGTQFYGLYSNCQAMTQKYTIIELALVHIWMACWFVVEIGCDKFIENMKNEENVVKVVEPIPILKFVLDKMSSVLSEKGMTQAMNIVQTVLKIDAKRLSVIRFRFTAVNCVEVTTMPDSSGLVCCNINCSYCMKGGSKVSK